MSCCVFSRAISGRTRFLIGVLVLALAVGITASQSVSPTRVKGDSKVDTRVYELRTYYAAPGKMEALHARFRDYTLKFFEKHGLKVEGFWKPLDEKAQSEKLVYLLSFPVRRRPTRHGKSSAKTPTGSKPGRIGKGRQAVNQAARIGLPSLDRLFSREITEICLSQGREAISAFARDFVLFFMSLPNDPFERMAVLLQMESKAQARQTLERVRRLTAAEAEKSGGCLLGLVVRDESAGMGGRFVLTLAKRGGTPLPWTRLQPGSPVLLSLKEERMTPAERRRLRARRRPTARRDERSS